MKIGILSVSFDNYSNRRMIFEAEQRGHQVVVVNYLRCYLKVKLNDLAIFYEGRSLNDFDAIIPRIGASHTFFGTSVVRQFEIMRTYCLNSSLGISRSRDKLRALQTLARMGFMIPDTGSSHSTNDVGGLIETVGGTPLVVKLIEGTQGLGVVLTRSYKAAESVIQAFCGLKSDILVQDFIDEAKGEDLRLFVVGDKVVAAMKRKAAKGEFRSNVHRGGSTHKVKITEKERSMAIKSAKALGLKIAGIDIIRSSKGPMILEVNSSPGLEGIEGSTGINVAAEIIKFIERRKKKEKKKFSKNTIET
jgi:ribosomal protein S6--L-glutamate ligase